MTWLLASVMILNPFSALEKAEVHASAHECAVCAPASPKLASLVALAWSESVQQAVQPAVPLPTLPGAPDPQQQARHNEDVKNDVELGRKYSEQVDKESKLSKDAAVIARVQRIGAEMAAIANLTPAETLWGDKRFSKFDYNFKVIEGKDVNAFSLPGGFIYVYDGLVKYAESDDEIAGVMAHEISHASFRHVATLQREQAKMANIQLPLIIAAILSGGQGSSGDLMVLGNLVGTATSSGWSVKAEIAADYGGFQYMRKSKYDPTAMLTFMERLARDERSRGQIDWGIYRTHPPGRERAQALTQYMEDAGIPIRRSRVTTTYRTLVRPGDEGTVEVAFAGKAIVAFSGSDALERADKVSTTLNDFFDTVPNLFEITGGGDPGHIMGKRQLLLEVLAQDAASAKLSVADYTQAVIRNLRGALYNIAYRVWDGA